MPQAAQTVSDTQGDNLSVQMLEGAGDAITVTDASISGGSAVLNSPTAAFNSNSPGKTVIVVGAGAAGATFETTILTYVGPTQVVLNASAATGVVNAEMTWGTDNGVALQSAFKQPHCLIPDGRFLCSAAIAVQDLSGIHIIGRGASSVIIPTTKFTTQNFITLLGCSDVEMHHFKIDGRYFPDVSQEIINGDGSANNPTYGNIKVHHCHFENCKPIVLGLGANTGKTAQDITYEHNRFLNCGAGSFLPNTIDTGSAGTKLRFRIQHNRFIYVTQPSSTSVAGVAIFCGHGTNTDFNVSKNIIEDAPIDAIQVFNRPFAGESTALSGFLIEGNIIRRPRWAGISIYGGTNVKLIGNTVVNPGIAVDVTTSFRRCGIAISNQISGVTNVATANLSIQGNNLIDDQGGGATMQYGIVESNLGGLNSTGGVGPNLIFGASIQSYNVGTLLGILHQDSTSNNVALNLSARTNVNTGATLQVPFQIHTHAVAAGAFTGLFNEMGTTAAAASGNFLLHHALNAKFSGGNWVSGADGGSNGFGVIAESYGSNGGLQIFAAPSTGGAPQTLTPSQLQGAWQLKIWPATGGTRLVNIGAGFIYESNNTSNDHGFWALANDGTQGILRLQDGTSAGGLDGLGSYILGRAINAGTLQVRNGNMQCNFGQPIGTVAARFQDNSTTALVDIGAGFIYSLNSLGKTTWALASSGGGLLRLADGSGAGGLDGLGSQVLLNSTSGVVQATVSVVAPTVNATSGFQANGVSGVTGTMTIPAATSPGSITIHEGIITAFTNPVGN